MWNIASVFFVLTTLVMEASMWYDGKDTIECRSDGLCRCKDITDGSVFLGWTGDIESCICFMNRKHYTDRDTLNGCIPKCRSDGWYDVEQLCYGDYFCADKEGDSYVGTTTKDAKKLDCSMYTANDSDDSDDSSDANNDGSTDGDDCDSSLITKMKKVIKDFIDEISKFL